MADEFDPDAYLNAPPAFDPDAYLNKPPTTQPAAPEPTGPGQLESLGRGALQGVTANFSDEARGAHAAGGTDWFGQAVGYGSPVMGPLLRGVYGAGKYFMGDERAKKAYDEAVEKDRRANEEAKKANPLMYGAGELAGAVGSMALAPAAAPLKGAGLARRTWEAGKTGAKIGGLYGGAAGAGEGVGTDKALKAGEGLLTGTLGGLAGGAAGEVLGTGAKAAWDKFGAPIASAVRGWRDPTGEGYKRAAGAVNSGADQIAAGSAKGMTGAEWLAAKNRGEPVMIVDLGGEPARAMLRSASNTSPEARGVIDNAVQDRFRTQVDRAGNFIRGMISGNANIWNKAEKLRADYDKWRAPLYEAAYKAGERPLYSETLERLAGAPAVADAMKGAVETGKNHAIKEGFGAFNPPVTIDSTGKLVFNKGPTGAPTYPDLRFWDYTYRRLRDEGQKLKQSGAGEEGNAVSGLAGQLRDELDRLVPQFGAARGEAAKWFKAEDVMEAGQKAVNFKGSPQELKALVDKIKNPRERELFEESYVSNLALKAENAPDNADLTKRLFNSKAERQRFEAVLGPSRAKAMQGFIDRERIYDWARTAVQGNSSTVRQMIESGLAGGAAGMYYGDGDVATSIGAGAGALAGLGARGVGFKHSVSGLVTSGAQKALGYVDRKTAEKAAEFLTSDDPEVLMKGLAMVRQNPRLAEGLNAIANRLWSLQGAQAARPNVAPLQLPAPVRAEEEEKPRRAEGGAVPFDEEEEPYDITGEEATLGTPLALQAPHPLSDEALAIAQINQAEAERRARSPSFEERYEGLRAKPGAHHAKGAGAVADWLQGRDSFKDRWEGKKAPVEEKPGHWARALGRGVDRAFGLNGQERYETWPEKMLVSGAKLPGDVYSGKEPIVEMDPATGEYRTAQKVIERAQDTSGLAGSGGIGGAEAGAVGIFGGKLAKTADLKKLRVAEVMDQYQRPPQAIWEATGWFKGADGQWRFEIPDAGSALKGAEHPVKVMDDYKAWLAKNNLPRQNPDVLLETATPEHVAPLKSFIDRLKAAQEHSFRGEEGVVNVFDHPALYKAYPELAKLPVRSQEISPAYGGYYGGSERGVTLNRNLGPEDARSVLLHELQHAVQEKEGFTRGTNPEYETRLLRNKFETLRMEQDQFDVEMRKLRQERGPEAYTTPEYLALERAYNNVSKQLERLGGQDWLRAGQEAYRRNAGEVEARNVQRRRDYDERARRVIPTMDEDVSRFFQHTPERGNTSASAASAETPLRVAARVGDQVFEGRPGEIHADLLERNPAIKRGARTEMDLDGMMGFVDAEGKFLTREQAAKKYAKLDKNYDLEEDPSLITHNAPVLWSDSSQPGTAVGALAHTKAFKQSPLDRTQTGWTFKDVAHPHKDMQPGDWRKVTRAAESGEGVQEVELPIKALNATQSTVNPDYKSVVPRGDGKDAPFVIKKNGSYYVQDGHHRLVRDADAGRQTAKVRLVDLDPPGTSLGQMRLLSDSSQPGAAVGALAHSGKGGQLYSAMQRAIENAPQKKMHASQWEGWLKNQPGVKKEELDWSFPKDLEGMVTKEDLLARVQERTPKLDTTEMGRKPLSADEIFHLADQEMARMEENGTFRQRRGESDDDFYERWHERHAELQEQYEREGAPTNRPGRFAAYQLPGAESTYREVVTTLPRRDSPRSDAIATEMRALREKYGDRWDTDMSPEDGAKYDALLAERKKLQEASQGPVYSSSHWPSETNPLAHMRMNDREIPGVGKSLHLEEVQSDWHQAGRKKGYKNLEVEQELEKIRAQLDNDDTLRNRALTEALRARRDELKALLNPSGVPDAPFKSTWADLSLKQAVLRAVAEGYDSISWTPGRQQADRYNLANHFNSITVVPLETGAKKWWPRLKNGGMGESFETDASGNVVRAGASYRDIIGKPVDEVVGKDVAEKGLRADKEVRLEGVDLSVGGEGMMKFYDKMLVDKANNLFKKWGAKVEYKDLPDPTKNKQWNSDELIRMGVFDSHEEIARLTPAERRERLRVGIGEDAIVPYTLKVPVLKITPKLREEVQKHGLALFEDSGAAGKPVAALANRENSAPINLGERREQKKVGEFHKGLMEDVRTSAQERAQVGREYHEEGKLPFAVGTRFTTEHSRKNGLPPLKVTGHYVDRKNPEKYGYYYERGTKGEDGYESGISLVNDPGRPRVSELSKEFKPFGGMRLLSDSSKPGTALNAVEIDDERVPRPPKEKQHKAYASGGRVSASNIDASPSDAQKEAGNYKKDKLSRHGLTITVENAKGSTRSGVSSDGRRWECTLPAAYGYLNGFFGKDKDQLDVYLGPHTNSNLVFIVDQKDLDTGQFDEHKIGLGFGSAAQYKTIYEKAFSDGKGKQRIRGFHALTVQQFKDWLDHGDTTKPYKAPTLPKASHKHAAYVASSDRPTKHCSVCTMYVPPTVGGPACTAVVSPIDPAGWCKYFRRA